MHIIKSSIWFRGSLSSFDKLELDFVHIGTSFNFCFPTELLSFLLDIYLYSDYGFVHLQQGLLLQSRLEILRGIKLNLVYL